MEQDTIIEIKNKRDKRCPIIGNKYIGSKFCQACSNFIGIAPIPDGETKFVRCKMAGEIIECQTEPDLFTPVKMCKHYKDIIVSSDQCIRCDSYKGCNKDINGTIKWIMCNHETKVITELSEQCIQEYMDLLLSYAPFYGGRKSSPYRLTIADFAEGKLIKIARDVKRDCFGTMKRMADHIYEAGGALPINRVPPLHDTNPCYACKPLGNKEELKLHELRKYVTSTPVQVTSVVDYMSNKIITLEAEIFLYPKGAPKE